WLVAGYQDQDLRGQLSPHYPAANSWWGLAHGSQIGQTSANLFRRSTLLALGGYRDDWPDAEDHELYLRFLTAGYLPRVDSALRCTVQDRPTNKQSRHDLPGHFIRRLDLQARLHRHLAAYQADFYREKGDELRALLLHHYRYWASFSPKQALLHAQPLLGGVGGWPPPYLRPFPALVVVALLQLWPGGGSEVTCLVALQLSVCLPNSSCRCAGHRIRYITILWC
ncbi:MAG: hypothetical protein HC821_02850, partial [Lewinella sp.]|nr:hypothetical protein [Lewinella sp.]